MAAGFASSRIHGRPRSLRITSGKGAMSGYPGNARASYEYSGWNALSGFATGRSPLQEGESFLNCAMMGGTAAITRSTSCSVL